MTPDATSCGVRAGIALPDPQDTPPKLPFV